MTGSLPLAKLAVQVVAGFGVSKIVTEVVRNNVAITTTAQAVSVKLGSFVLGSMLVEQSSNHIERATNDVVAWFKKQKTEDDKPDLEVVR